MTAFPAHWWRHLLTSFNLFHNFWPYLLGAAGGQQIWQKLRQRRAAAWPSADGEVQHTNVEHKNGYLVTLEYRYFARSQYHYGKYTRRFRGKKDAETFADALHGRHIQVRYQEDKPEVSVILEDDLRMTGALETT
ncbi:MAG TPA: DUF3592 domain-containing protein [Acidobacteriaceae bacterium]|nr:DUF3592 domain-containing protein [Acidobacteriaceae bacterium]